MRNNSLIYFSFFSCINRNAILDAPVAEDETASPTELKIYIEATIGKGFAGDIAIDDLVITDSPCGTYTSLHQIIK